MYNQKKKRIVTILITIIILILILIVGSIFIYAKTDLFRSDETLFYKYATNALNSLQYVENKHLTSIEEIKEKQQYRIDGTFTYTSSNSSSKSAKAQAKTLMIVNKPNKEAYGSFDLLQNKNSIFKLEYVKNNNIYALKSNEIANAYIGIRNENLNTLAQNLESKNALIMPDSIQESKINEIFKLTVEEKMHIREMYMNILQQNIDTTKYTSEKGLTAERNGKKYKATTYRLSLTNQELAELMEIIIQNLQNDDETLKIIMEKAKLLGLEEKYTQKDTLIEELQKQIDKTKGNTTVGTGLSITIYVKSGKVITTEIIYKNEKKYIIYGTSTEKTTKRYLQIEDFNANAQNQLIELTEQEDRSSTKSIYTLTLNLNNKTKTNIKYTISGSAASSEKSNKITTTVDIKKETQNVTQQYKYSGKMAVDNSVRINTLRLDQSNCAILNDYPKEQAKQLVQAISKRTNEVINQKLKTLKFIK